MNTPKKPKYQTPQELAEARGKRFSTNTTPFLTPPCGRNDGCDPMHPYATAMLPQHILDVLEAEKQRLRD